MDKRDQFKPAWLENSAFGWPDVLTMLFACLVLLGLATGIRDLNLPLHHGANLAHLKLLMLPYYAFRTVVRMAIALVFSLLCTFYLGNLAATNSRAERWIIPAIDVLQSVPILGFLSLAIATLRIFFPDSLIAPEISAIFAIFTSQVWNMILSFYKSLKTLPKEYLQLSAVFNLNPRTQFWRIRVPYAAPNLIWNTMLSMSASWFFLVAAEAVSVAGHTVMLPGIGSFLALALIHQRTDLLLISILVMLIVMIAYDQMIFRPLLQAANAYHHSNGQTDTSWARALWKKARWVAKYWNRFVDFYLSQSTTSIIRLKISNATRPRQTIKKMSLFMILFALVAWLLSHTTEISWWHELKKIPYLLWLGLLSALRVFFVLLIAILIWTPIGIWIGQSSQKAKWGASIAQFFAAFPANCFYQPLLLLILYFHLNFEYWCCAMLLLGCQWYILFNVISGTQQIAKEWCWVADIFNLKGFQRWRRLYLPAVTPHLITGAITASGGAWNATIVAEILAWGPKELKATGLGCYIAEASSASHYNDLILAIMVMSGYVLALNRLVWLPLYRHSQKTQGLSSSHDSTRAG